MKARIYTTPVCPWCKKAKEFLKKNNVEFDEVNVEGNQAAVKELMKLSGQMGVPVIVAGEEVVVGYLEDEIRQALNI